MTQFVAFLRGINVGGHCLVKKEKLREAFVSLGFSNVSTYKQSGNVIFETDLDQEAAHERIKKELSQLLNCNPVVLLRAMTQLEELIKRDPFKNLGTEGASFLVTFMADKPKPDLTLPVRIPNSTADIILITGSEAYSVSRGHGDGGKPNPYIEKTLKTQATTRNLNIIKEIIQAHSKQNTVEKRDNSTKSPF
jgi:uncharacterized protein (DUF1697 family)